jgi:DNA polymerase I-like protein with 3'-5' exonuclease and polymerase domains
VNSRYKCATYGLHEHGVAQLDVPLEAEVGAGPNWKQAH